MIGTMILAHALPLWQAVSPEVQQAIQEQVQEELRRGRFREGFGPGSVLGPLIPIALFAMIVLIIFVASRRRHAELLARAEVQFRKRIRGISQYRRKSPFFCDVVFAHFWSAL